MRVPHAGRPPEDDSTDVVADKPVLFYVVRRATRNFAAHRAADVAAALTYYAVLAVGPALIALVSTLALLGRSDEVLTRMTAIVTDLAPGSAAQTVERLLDRISASPSLGLGVVLGVLGALWSASAYVGAFARAMNTVFEVEEGRPFWKLRPLVYLITTVVLILVATVATALVVSGPIAEAIGRAVGMADATVTIWNTVKWPIVLLLVVVVVTLLYYGTPNVRRPKVRMLSAGALIAILAWVGASIGFGYYVSQFGRYDATYGSLGGVVVFLLWLWITNIALVFGAELDAELERRRQLLAGIPAEKELQLPLRDTSAARKRAVKAAESVAVARVVRMRASRKLEEANGDDDGRDPIDGPDRGRDR